MANVPAAEGDTLFVANGSVDGGGISAVARGGHGVEGLATGSESGPGIGVRGVSNASETGFGDGPGDGVVGLSGTGHGVFGLSDAGSGVSGHSDSGVGGSFSTNSGKALQVDGPASIVATVDGTQGDTLFVENRLIGEGGLPGGAISATSHGTHGVEGAAFPTDLLDPEGEPQLGIGVRGVSMSAEGGFGEGPGDGVHGLSGTGVGVLGLTRHGTGVEARSDFPDGFALVVRGRSLFSTAGSAVIPAGQNSVFVANPDVAEDSHVSVTLVSDPGQRTIRWVERDPGSGFTVHLSFAPVRQRSETHLTYLIVGPFD